MLVNMENERDTPTPNREKAEEGEEGIGPTILKVQYYTGSYNITVNPQVNNVIQGAGCY